VTGAEWRETEVVIVEDQRWQRTGRIFADSRFLDSPSILGTVGEIQVIYA